MLKLSFESHVLVNGHQRILFVKSSRVPVMLNSIQGDVIAVAAPTPRPSATRASSLQASANELLPLLDLLAFLYPYLHIRSHVNQVDC